MNKTAYICSLKYSIGLTKEFFLMGSELQKSGWSVKYLLAQEYFCLLKEFPSIEKNQIHFITDSKNLKTLLIETIFFLKFITKLKNILCFQKADFVCVYNPHPFNSTILKYSKKINSNVINSIYFHEPYKENKLRYGLLGGFFELVGEKISKFCLKYVTDLIFPSPYSKELYLKKYNKKYPSIKFHIAPLLLPTIENKSCNTQPTYLSLVGTINKDRSADEFFSFISYCSEHNLTEYSFCIITKSNISKYLSPLSENEKSLLTVINKDKISDCEIEQVLTNSIATFLSHKSITQSGNVPVAFRSGTPIIARNLLGFSQHIFHKLNGYLVNEIITNEELLEAITYINANHEKLSNNAKESFESIFSEHNFSKYYSWLLDLSSYSLV